MHSMNMWHRDIKPNNILIHNGTYKICDYGVSTILIDDPKIMVKRT